MLLIDDLLLAPFSGWNLSRFAGVSESGVPNARGFRVLGWEAGARRRNPERSRGISRWRRNASN
jgi:hypothetical protein